MGRKSKPANAASAASASAGSAYESTFQGALTGYSDVMGNMIRSSFAVEAAAAQRAQAVAFEAQQAQTAEIEIQELCEHFGITGEHVDRLRRLLRKRMEKGGREGFESDIAKLWEVMELARRPDSMLIVKMREMETGVFVGKTKPSGALLEITKKYRLDDEASSKLAEVMALRQETLAEDLKQIDKHLAVAGKPSAAAMMLLPKLRQPGPLEDPRPPPASAPPQSGSGDRDRDREREREKERDRRKEPHRDHDRDRHRRRSRSGEGRRSRSRDRG
mmetsp:Transcript_49251/g.157531  ORF Transcript_49251/g.157531 Transcript_49251/m.157531 type:complete len:275 (-) Transcript_49251:28-852(-)